MWYVSFLEMDPPNSLKRVLSREGLTVVLAVDQELIASMTIPTVITSPGEAF